MINLATKAITNLTYLNDIRISEILTTVDLEEYVKLSELTDSSLDVAFKTINGCELVSEERYQTNRPYIPVVKTDGLMEVGRYIDFHSNNSTTTDYTAKIDVSDTNAFNLLNSTINANDINAIRSSMSKGNMYSGFRIGKEKSTNLCTVLRFSYLVNNKKSLDMDSLAITVYLQFIHIR